MALPRRLLFAVIALAGLGFGASACSAGSPSAAVVNGTKISQAQLLRELGSIKANKAFVTAYDQSAQQNGHASVLSTGTASPTYTQDFTAIVLGTDIQGTVIHDEVVRRKIEPSAADVTAAAAATSQQFGTDPSGKPVFDGFDPWFKGVWQRRQAESEALRKSIGAPTVDDAAIKQFYDTNPTLFITNECVSHILVKTQAEADAIRARLVAGADFAAQAKQFSTDTASGAKGGDLGCAAPGQYVAQFEQVADAIPVNQLSPVVQTQFGYHLIKVTNRTVAPFDDTAKAAIKQRLQQPGTC